MSYNPGQGHHVGSRIPSGIPFYGTDANDPVYRGDAAFVIEADDATKYLKAPNFLVPNGGNVGSVGASDAMTIASNGDVTMAYDLSITGDLTVNGTTTTVNSTTVTIDDPIFTLGGDGSGIDDDKDRGIEFKWHNGVTAKVGYFGFDDSTGRFTFIPDATITSEVAAGTVGTIEANLLGDVTGNADTATALETARDFSITGEITAAAQSFDGTGNVVLSASLDNTAITSQTELAEGPNDADYLLIYDASATALKKISVANFDTGAMDDFAIVGDNGVPQIVHDGETITFAGATGLDTAVTATNTVTYTIDISEYSTAAVAAGDSFLVLDSDGTTEQRATVDQLGTYLAGDNITNTAGVLSVADSDIEDAIFTVGNFVDSTRVNFTVTAGDSVTADLIANTISETYLTASVAGDGLTGGNGSPLAVGAGALIDVTADAVDVDLTEAAAATIAAGDFLIFLDGGTAGTASKGSVNDVTTLFAGDGLVANGAALDVNVDDSTLEVATDVVQIKDAGVTEVKRSRTVESVSTTTSITKDIVLCTAGASGYTVTLPAPVVGKIVIVKKVDSAAGVITVSRNSADTIDGSITKALYAQYESITVVSDGTDWFII